MADIVSVLVGGAVALAGGVLTKLWESRIERRALAHALAGEIGAITEIVERRNYQGLVRLIVEAVKASHEPQFIQVPISQQYFTAYEANAAKIGLLPSKAARDVARFYFFAKSMVEDVTTEKIRPRTEAEALDRLVQLDDLLTTLIALGKSLPNRLEAV